MDPAHLRLIPLAHIQRNGLTQVRQCIDQDLVGEYAEAMLAGSTFPPIVVFQERSYYWLADGFHRVAAAELAQMHTIPGNVHIGGWREALLYACGANSEHGLRRSNADKRRAVEILLQDDEWGTRSDNWIARHCAVSQPFVSGVRAEIFATSNGDKSELRFGLDGRVINTAQIGGRRRDPTSFQREPSTIMPLFSSASVEWYTPSGIVDRIICVLGTIDLDPCSNSHEAPNIPARQHFTVADDGLKKAWTGTVFMNPPYGRTIGRWVEKFCNSFESQSTRDSIALLPARTDTDWFRRLRNATICFVDGRLKFSGATNGAPFPSLVAYLGEDLPRFIQAFGELGDIWSRVDTPIASEGRMNAGRAVKGIVEGNQ